jgi:hypothetical protein
LEKFPLEIGGIVTEWYENAHQNWISLIAFLIRRIKIFPNGTTSQTQNHLSVFLSCQSKNQLKNLPKFKASFVLGIV